MLSASIKGIASHTTIDMTTKAALHLVEGLKGFLVDCLKGVDRQAGVKNELSEKKIITKKREF